MELSVAERRALAKRACTAKEYQAWDLREIHGMRLRRIAAELEVSLTTVCDRLDNARRKIARAGIAV